ncbi:MAG: hypothetical protein ACE5RC_01165 [Nitrosopumilus sp.]
MDQKETDEILNHIKLKFDEEVPGIVKMVVRKKIGRFQAFDVEALPESLRNCTVENLIDIVQKGIESGKLKL